MHEYSLWGVEARDSIKKVKACRKLRSDATNSTITKSLHSSKILKIIRIRKLI